MANLYGQVQAVLESSVAEVR